MVVVFLLAISTLTFVGALPKPEMKHHASGVIELWLNDVPGMTKAIVDYSFSTYSHTSILDQASDSRWYHVNNEAKYNGKDTITYILLAVVNGNPITSTGQIEPGEKGLIPTPPRRVRRGTVVFRDDFNGAFKTANWDYEVSMYGGYNWEVQAYVPDRRNIYTKNGHLFIKPTLTTEHPMFDEASLTSGIMDMNELYGSCTNYDRFGCRREGKYGLLPPIMSGKIKSKYTIHYGSVEVRARTPRGDWIWPAIWMLPRNSKYGEWPASGEIDIMESRGQCAVGPPKCENGHTCVNHKCNLVAGNNHGVNEVGATLHWGPTPSQNKFMSTHGALQGQWSTEMHTYRLDWTVDHIQVFVDNSPILNIPIDESFWERGGFQGDNIWGSGSKAAPFDTPFYLILNVAVAGTNGFFPDNWNYNTPKPWNNTTPTITKDFWNGRGDWLPTWICKNAMEIDYVQMIQY